MLRATTSARVEQRLTLIDNGTSTSFLRSALEFARFDNGNFLGPMGGLGPALRATCKTAQREVDHLYLSNRLHRYELNFNPHRRRITDPYELVAFTHETFHFEELDLSDGKGDGGSVGPIVPACCVAGIHADYLNVQNCRTNGDGDFSAARVRVMMMVGSTNIFKPPYSAARIIAHDSNINEIPKNRIIKTAGQPDKYEEPNLIELDVCSSFNNLDVANSVLSLQKVDCRGVDDNQLGYLQNCDLRYMRSNVDFDANPCQFLHLRTLHNGGGKGVPDAPSLQHISFIEYSAEDMRKACAELDEKCPDIRVIECDASGYISECDARGYIRQVKKNLLISLPTNMDKYSIHLDEMTPEAEQEWIDFLESIDPEAMIAINCYTMEFEYDDEVVWRTADEILADF